MNQPSPPHPENADGDFYVECDSCLACEAPYAEAPDLMGRPSSSEANSGCFFRKQPGTADELDRACNAVAVSCVEAVRYAGRSPEILRKLYDDGAYASCDVSLEHPTEREQLVIDHVNCNYASIAKFGFLWTYVIEESSDREIIAACFGPFKHTLGIFAVDKVSQEVTLLQDDAKYRPRYDFFDRPVMNR